MWDAPGDTDHHNGIHIWAVNGSPSHSNIQDIKVYSNYIYGDIGATPTAYIYIDPENGGNITAEIFNNLVANTSATDAQALGTGGNGLVFCQGGTCSFYNNTLVGPVTTGGAGFEFYGTATVKNNIFSTLQTAMYSQNGTLSASDYNDFYNIGTEIIRFNPGNLYTTLAAWQASTGNPDAHSTTGNPKLTATYHLTDSTSSAWQAGANLTSLNITALNIDKAGVLRPTVGPWDMGAFEDSGTLAGRPNPPSNLQVTVR
jgi:hypothetical protein